MRLVQGPIIQNLLMHRAGGDENEPTNSRLTCSLNQLHRADNVFLGKRHGVAFASTKPAPGPVQT